MHYRSRLSKYPALQLFWDFGGGRKLAYEGGSAFASPKTKHQNCFFPPMRRGLNSYDNPIAFGDALHPCWMEPKSDLRYLKQSGLMNKVKLSNAQDFLKAFISAWAEPRGTSRNCRLEAAYTKAKPRSSVTTLSLV